MWVLALRFTPILAAVHLVLGGPLAFSDEFASDWPREVQRVWVGPVYWANRLQDWRIRDGRLECVEASADRPMRTVHLLTRALAETPGTLEMSVTTGPLEAGSQSDPNAWVGFLIGAGGENVDYRLSALVHHRPAEDGGLFVGIDGSGRIMFRDNAVGRVGGLRGPLTPADLPILRATTQPETETWTRLPAALRLTLYAEPAGERYVLRLVAFDPERRRNLGEATLDGVDPGKLSGNLALVSHGSPAGGQQGWWFRDWRISGTKVATHEERAYGPVLAAC
jgi:alkaline phosphatase D